MYRLTINVFFSSLHCTVLYWFLQPSQTQSPCHSSLLSVFILISHTALSLANFCATVVRFAESNPGIWMMHCHINWHQVRIKPTRHNTTRHNRRQIAKLNSLEFVDSSAGDYLFIQQGKLILNEHVRYLSIEATIRIEDAILFSFA